MKRALRFINQQHGRRRIYLAMQRFEKEMHPAFGPAESTFDAHQRPLLVWGALPPLNQRFEER